MGIMKRHWLIGIGGAILLMVVYLSVITLAQGLTHALEQTAKLWYWVLALAGGFGFQSGLFSFIRQRLQERRAMTTGSITASGGISTGSMVACCAHHLSDVLPLLGLSGLAIFLARYQLFFIMAGVLANMMGITIMLETIQRHGLSSRLIRWRWNMNWLKKGVMVSSALILTATFFLIFLKS